MAAKIWFCRTCGYEVPGRGRCHSCGGRLERSPLPELPVGDEEDEVGYRVEDWAPEARGRLIVALIEAGVEHRFEDEDLVVAADDEERTDDVVARVEAEGPVVIDDDDEDDDDSVGAELEIGPEDAALLAEVQLLARAAQRLRVDPTDMHADGDVAQASAAVFASDRFVAADPDTWAAVGRVTRRLLAALGADDALEDEIRKQASVLAKLLDPVFAEGSVADEEGEADEGGDVEDGDVDEEADLDEADLDELVETDTSGASDSPAESVDDAEDIEQVDNAEDVEDLEDVAAPAARAAASATAASGEAVYELPEWLPEQRAQLSVLFDDSGIPHRWDQGNLIVPAAREADAEALFDRVEGAVDDEDDDDARYRSLEELFAAADRFIHDPGNRSKALEVVRAVEEADGPAPVGLDDAQWWTIRTRARTVADAIEHDGNLEVIFAEATTLRDLLRALV